MVATKEFLPDLISFANLRDDDWSNEILSRVSIGGDLIAVEARYHKTCCAKFYARTPKVPSGQAGRPQDLLYERGFEQLFTFLEENDECQYSMTELVTKMKEYLPADYPLVSKVTLKAK